MDKIDIIYFAVFGVGILFNIYVYFRNPQIKTEKELIQMKADINSQQKEINDIKQLKLKELKTELRHLNNNVNSLSGTVIQLTTIINERIPKK